MAIADDFSVYTGTKTIRHTNASSDTQYTVQAFYSWLMDMFDEPAYMSFPKPMKYNTPTSYTMLNGWFIDNGDESNALQYLYEGAIDTSGYADDVLVVDADGMTNFVSTDKDKMIVETTDVGPLLAYKNDYPVSGDARFWVRDTNSHGTIHNNDTFTTTGGTGAGTADGDSYTGEEVYSNLYTIASFPADVSPQVYIFQQDPDGTNTRIVEWSNTDNFDRGTIDVIIPVRVGGAWIQGGSSGTNGYVSAFARHGGDTFSHVDDIDLSAGARTPIALETAADEVNISSTNDNYIEWYMLFDGQTSAIAVDDVIQDVSTAALTPPTWSAEVVYVDDKGAYGCLGLRALFGTPANNDSIFVGTTDCADVLGKAGDTYVPYDAEGGTPPTADGTVMVGGTSGAKRLLRGVYDGGTAGLLVLACQHDHSVVSGTSRDPYYRDFQDDEQIQEDGVPANYYYSSAASVSAVSGMSDITVGHINGTLAVNTFAGTFIEGERVTWTGGGPAILAYSNGSSSITLANVEDETNLTNDGQTITGDLSGATCDTNGTGGLSDGNTQNYEFPLQSTGATYNVFIDGGYIYEAARTLEHIYAYLQYICSDGRDGTFYTSPAGTAIVEVEPQAYITAVTGHAISKVAPFGTLAGGVFFGAQGVWLEGMDTGDANSIKLTDNGGTLREPDTSVEVKVTNTRVDDVIVVALEDGSTGEFKKDQYTGHATLNTQGRAYFDQDAAGGGFPNDTPSSGTFTVTAADELEEHRYRYSSWANTGGSGDDGIFTLATSDSGTATSGTAARDLRDSGNPFDDVQRGDIIRRTSGAGGWCYITEVVSVSQVYTTNFYGGETAWASGDTFETNKLVQAYDGSDTFFVPYMDSIEDTGTDGSPGSETVTLTYVSARAVVIRVRNVEAATKLQPFVTTSDITTAGMTVSVIRTEDEVYS